MAKKRPNNVGVAEAAEYLWAIFDEFRAKDETAQLMMRRARTLLDVCTDCAMRAVQANAVAAAKRAALRKGSK